MPDDKTKTVTTQEKPDQKIIIGGTGDGGMKSQLMVTPAGQPDVQVYLIPTALAVLVRFFETFLTGLLSTATVAGLSNQLIPFADFSDLVRVSASVAMTGAVYGMLKDLVVIAGRLKKRFPLLDV